MDAAISLILWPLIFFVLATYECVWLDRHRHTTEPAAAIRHATAAYILGGIAVLITLGRVVLIAGSSSRHALAVLPLAFVLVVLSFMMLNASVPRRVSAGALAVELARIRSIALPVVFAGVLAAAVVALMVFDFGFIGVVVMCSAAALASFGISASATLVLRFFQHRSELD